MVRVAPVWLLIASVALAQDNAPVAEKSAPPTEDGIAAAKRDFGSIKAARGSLEQPARLDLPSLSAPELQIAPSLPLPTPSSRPDPRAAKKSANWLVDAMMKPEGKNSRDPRTKSSELGKHDQVDSTRDTLNSRDSETERLAGNGETDLREAADKSEPRAQETPVAEKRTGPEFNPLQSYMAGWMTSQDYTLLKPGLDGAAASSLASRGDPSVPAAGTDLSVLGDTGSALDLSTTSKGAAFALPKPADNPFLQSLSANGAPALPAFVAPLAPSSPGPANSVFTPPGLDPAPAKSKIPDFAKPATDEKYFKQLKRF